jgi:molecular chaperone GrpE
MTDKEHVRPEQEDVNAEPAPGTSVDDEVAGTDAGESQEGDATGERDGTTESDTSTERDELLQRLREENEALQQENSELKNQYLRKQADVENFRKRMVRDKQEAVSYANQQLLLDLTAVIDDFERAISSAEESRDYDAFHDGIVLIEKQLTGMLERKWGLKRFESEGQSFDPQRHEAVTTEPRGDHESSIVLEEYQRGYTLHDRVLRSAKVKVSMPSTD